MKRFVLVLVALGAVAMFVGCKKDKKKDAADEAGKTTDTATATDTAATDKPADPAATDPAAAGAAADPAAAGDTPADPAAAGGDATTGIAECDAYIKRLMSCDKYPQQGKDALKQSMDAWKQAAGAGGDAAKAAADACEPRPASSRWAADHPLAFTWRQSAPG
jgi:hypothetical protein